MQNKLHVFVRHSRVFPRVLAFSLAFILLFPFLSNVCHEGPGGAHSYIGPRQVCAAEQGMGLIQCLELNSDLARFTTHIKLLLQQIRLLNRFECGW